MGSHVATVAWRRAEGEAFTDGRYGRTHVWKFDGGAEVAASASPGIVPLPFSSAAAVDPEEAFVAALSSCHMLFFLSLAAKRGLVVDSYEDDAVGTMETGADGRASITRVVLRPRVRYAGTAPARTVEEELHHRAHDLCFIANSVKTAVAVEPG